MKELEANKKALQNARKATDILLGITSLGFIAPLGLAPFVDDNVNRIGTYVLLGSCFTSFGLIYLNHKIDKYLEK